MLIKTSRFGEVEVGPEEIIIFSHGLPAFEHLREFFLYPIPENPAFIWLQAKEDPDVAFLLVDPFLFFPGYVVELTPDVQEELGIKDLMEVLVMAPVTIPEGEIRKMTANLLGPIVINRASRRGRQLVLEGTPYTTRHPLFAK